MPEPTLRDLFAAHALAGMCAAGVATCDLGAPEVATLAYGYADAMLRARVNTIEGAQDKRRTA